jgi:hypothetical protein
MNAQELNDYIEKLNVDADELEGYLFEVSIYSEGAITYSELREMPLKRIKIFEERLTDYMKKKSGKKGQEYL